MTPRYCGALPVSGACRADSYGAEGSGASHGCEGGNNTSIWPENLPETIGNL
jgi:hypothetical protein